MARSFLRFCTVRELKNFYTVPDDINQNFFKFLLFVDYSLNLIIFFMSAGKIDVFVTCFSEIIFGSNIANNITSFFNN